MNELRPDGQPYKTTRALREAVSRYLKTPKGKAARRRYETSAKGEATRADYKARRERGRRYLRRLQITLSINIVVERDGDGFHAFCPTLKGLHTCGCDFRDAMVNAKYAAEAYIQSLIKHGESIPTSLGHQEGEG